jgi:hypothetical protein
MTCERCKSDIPATDPVFRTYWPEKSGYPKRVATCRVCVERMYGWSLGPKDWALGSFHSPKPCEACGRIVYNSRYWRIKLVVCSERCRQKIYNSRKPHRKVQHRTIICQDCAKPFTAVRAHQRYCSAACKQSAYRKRRRERAARE